MPDVREYAEDHEETLRAMWMGLLKHVKFCLPCKVTVDSDGHTCTLQPLIKGQITQQDGTVQQVNLPVLDTVPIHFPGGGGVTHTFPIKADDEGIAIFSTRPIDTWHQQGDVQAPIDDRMHSMSDAFFIPGIRSTPRKLNPPPSTTAAQMRSDDGNHFVELHPTDGIKLKSTKTITHDATEGMTLTTGGVINIG